MRSIWLPQKRKGVTQLITRQRVIPLFGRFMICMMIVVACLGTALSQRACHAGYIDVDPWSMIIEDLRKPNHFAILEMLNVNLLLSHAMEREEIPEWLIQLVGDASKVDCLPLLGEWVSGLPDLEQTLKESPAYGNRVESYSLQTLMRTDHQHSTYLPSNIPMGNYYAAYDGSACTAISWDLLHSQKRPWATECNAGRASGSILGAIMLNAGSLRITRPVTLLIDGAGHICILTRIDDIFGLDGIGGLGPALDSNNRLVVGAEEEAVGVVNEMGISLVHPDTLIP